MPWSAGKKERVAEVLRDSLRRKMRTYRPEPAVMPFQTRLLGSDRMALTSFIRSLNTNFGSSIFEPVAAALAEGNFHSVTCQQSVGTHITDGAQAAIQNIMNRLSTAEAKPDKQAEISTIRAVCQTGERQEVQLTKADIKLIGSDGTHYLIDIKTAKPNKGDIQGMKRTLLEWTAATLLENPAAKVHPLIAIPYNPYEPNPYERWTVRGMLDLENDMKVAEDFWDFLAGKGSYQILLDIFQAVGIELRGEIDNYFRQYVQ